MNELQYLGCYGEHEGSCNQVLESDKSRRTFEAQ